jgi:hypothetical protein
MALSGLLLAAVAAIALYCVRPVANDWGGEDKSAYLRPSLDFVLRMNEIGCLRRGVDPYDVWSEKIVLEPYCAYAKVLPAEVEVYEPVNAYPPWEYLYMMPLGFLPRRTAWVVFALGMFACIAFLFAAGWKKSRRTLGDRWLSLAAAAAPLLVVSYSLWANFRAGNLALYSLAATVAALMCLNRGRRVAAGIMWALAMIKPQLALPLAVPLLIRRQFAVCAVAVAVCVVSSLPASFMCGKSLLEMIPASISASSWAFNGCGTMPYFLCRSMPDRIDIVIGAAVGLVAAAVATWKVRKSDDWFVLAMPATVVAMAWTYAQPYSYVYAYLMVLVMTLEALSNPGNRICKVLLALSVPFAARVYMCIHGIWMELGGRLGLPPFPAGLHYSLDSLNSTALLAIAAVFVFFGSGGARSGGARPSRGC